MELIQQVNPQVASQIGRLARQTAALIRTAKDIVTRHQILSRVLCLGVGPTAVLVVMELSNYLFDWAG